MKIFKKVVVKLECFMETVKCVLATVWNFLCSKRVLTCLAFAVFFTGIAMAEGSQAGINAIGVVEKDIIKYVGPVRQLLYAIAGVVALTGAISVYIKMNNEEQDVKKSIMLIVGACIFLIAAAEALPKFFGI